MPRVNSCQVNIHWPSCDSSGSSSKQIRSEREHSEEISSKNKEDKAWLAYTSCPLTYASVSADRRQQIVSNLRPLWSAAGCGKHSSPLAPLAPWPPQCRIRYWVRNSGKCKPFWRVIEVPGFKALPDRLWTFKKVKANPKKKGHALTITQANHLDLVCWTACRLFRIESVGFRRGRRSNRRALVDTKGLTRATEKITVSQFVTQFD